MINQFQTNQIIMKSTTPFASKKLLMTSIGGLCLLGLVSWSPPANENVLVNPGNVQVRGGVFEVRATNSTANQLGTSPAALVGGGNNIVGAGSTNDLGRGLVVGASNRFASPSGFSAVVGDSNFVWSRSSLVVGNENKVTKDAATPEASTRYSVIVGLGNVINGGRESMLVAGKDNVMDANQSLVVGTGNNVEGATVGAPSWHSGAIGLSNHVMATSGWTIPLER